MGAIKAIECDTESCKKLMRSEGKEYIRIHGNLHCGSESLVPGMDNVDKEGKVIGMNFYCLDCFRKLIPGNAPVARDTTPIASVDVNEITDINSHPKKARTSAAVK